MNKAPSTSDIEALIAEAIEAANEPFTALAELDETARELEAAEPALRVSVAAGNVNDAAQLTCNRIRLKESIPAARAEAEGRRLSALRSLWEVTGNAMTQAGEDAERVLADEKQRLDEAVLPVLLPLLAPGVTASVASFAGSTSAGRRASELLSAISMIIADYPGGIIYNLNGNCKPVELDGARRQAFKRTDRVLAAWKQFTDAK